MSVVLVPRKGLEPSRLAAHGPEPCASTNSATWAGAAALLSAGPAAVNAAATIRTRSVSRKLLAASAKPRPVDGISSETHPYGPYGTPTGRISVRFNPK